MTSVLALKTESCQDANFIVTGGTAYSHNVEYSLVPL